MSCLRLFWSVIICEEAIFFEGLSKCIRIIYGTITQILIKTQMIVRSSIFQIFSKANICIVFFCIGIYIFGPFFVKTQLQWNNYRSLTFWHAGEKWRNILLWGDISDCITNYILKQTLCILHIVCNEILCSFALKNQ